MLVVAGCSQCGKGQGAVPPPTMLAERAMTDGTYDLASYPDCTGQYIGAHYGEWAYCVGFGTEHERLFRPAQKSAMVTYYNSFSPNPDLFFDYTQRFCEQAMLDLFGE